jgi:biopolymer transport protein ExbB
MLMDFLISGGPVMIPIGLCSVIALTTFFERTWALRRVCVVPESLSVQLMLLLKEKRWDDARIMCRAHPVALARLVEVALEVRHAPRAVIKERLEEVGRREAAEMERWIPIVGTIASIAPLLGLLGTVGGMILTFQVIQQQGLGDAGSLAGGISQALVTTFAGLSVGIPAVVGNRYLLSKVDGLLLELEEASLGALELLVDYGEVSADGIEP